MATPPTRVSASASALNSTTSPKSVSVTVQTGDIIVVCGVIADQTQVINTPTGGSLTYTLQAALTGVSGTSPAYLWTSTATSSTTFSVSCTSTATTQFWGITVYVWRGSNGVGAVSTAQTTGAPSVSLTTTQANSAIVWISGDFNAIDGTSRTWATVNSITPTAGNGLEVAYFRDATEYTYYSADWSDVGAAGAKSPGITAPTGQKFSAIAIEIKGFIPLGLPFMRNQLGSSAALVVEAAWGADLTASSASWTWTDITSDVRQVQGQGITITIGRPDEFSQAPPATCTFQLKNPTGAYTPFSPTAANYPNLRKNTPIRVRVTLDGSNYFVRFFGYADGFPPDWEAQGRSAYISVSASGILRRVQQGHTPLRSPLTRWHLRYGAVGLWPLDDGSDATTGGSLTTAGSLMTVSGTASFGQTSTLAGTNQVVVVNPGTTMPGPLNGVSNTGFVAMDFWVKMFTTSATNTQTHITTLASLGGVPGARVFAINATPGPAGFQVAFNDSTGGLWTLDSGVGSPGSSVNPYDGGWHNVFFTMTQNGSNVDTVLYVDGAQADSRTITSFTLAAPIAAYAINGIFLGDTGNISFAGMAVHTNSSVTASYSAGLGFAAEVAATRLARLMTEEGGNGIPLSTSGSSSALMGAQGVDTFVNLLRECESTDVGILYDGLSQGFNYVCRSALYNQSTALTIDANSGQVSATTPLSPTDDDQRLRNLWVASRNNGASATYADTTGVLGTNAVGTYDSQTTVNPSQDSTLRDIAAWLVHLGTVEGLRYPNLYLDLTGAPELASAWLNTTLGERVDVTNLQNRLTQHPPGTVSLILEGYTEFLNAKLWRITGNCSPYRPWEVFTVADSRLGRLQTDGSTLNSSATSGATSLSVASSGRVWDTGATPFDIEVEGEQITVTAISGSSSPQTFTVTRSANGIAKAHNSGVTVKLWKPGVLAL